MYRYHRIAVAILLGMASNATSADRVDDYIRFVMKDQHIPGLSLAIIQDGKVIKAKGYGWANMELRFRATPETVYQIQSMTKSFTATGIMMLVEESKIGLDDPISKYLENLPEAWKPVTVRHLLTHTSGIKDFINEPTVNLKLDVTPEEVIRYLSNLPLNFVPGEQWAYSNTNYHLLGMIIRKVTGKLWGDFLKERIFDLLGMNDTQVISLSDVIPNRASGYYWENGSLRNGEFVAPSILGYAGGGIRSTVLDMAKWDAALYTEKLLKKLTLEQMWTPAKLKDGKAVEYGFGWGVGQRNGHRTVGHGGAHMTGFTSNISRFPDDKLTVVVLTNTRIADTQTIAHRVAGIYIPVIAPPTYKPIKDKEPQVTAMVKEIILKTIDGTLQPGKFTPAIQADIFPAKIKQAGDFLKSLGPLRSVTLVEYKDEEKRKTYRYRVIFKEMPLLFFMGMTPEGLISDLLLNPDS